MGTLIKDSTKFFYVTGLQNAHAMETQAIEILSRQIDRLENYPELEHKLRLHLDESKQQRLRLEEVLKSLSETYSSVKEAVLGLGGNLAAMAHTAASDEIIKNTISNYMFENFEIASYQSLIVMAETAGHSQGAAAARLSLAEEEEMALWIRDRIASITSTFLHRAQIGTTADH